jgi:hypothetical protein
VKGSDETSKVTENWEEISTENRWLEELGQDSKVFIFRMLDHGQGCPARPIPFDFVTAILLGQRLIKPFLFHATHIPSDSILDNVCCLRYCRYLRLCEPTNCASGCSGIVHPDAAE